MNDMIIENAQYEIGNAMIRATIDGVEMSVPLAEGNRHYDEITRQVAEGTLTIQAAAAAPQEAE